MCTTSTPGHIQTTETVYELLQDLFAFEPRGPINIRGKGVMNVFYLMEKKDPVAISQKQAISLPEPPAESSASEPASSSYMLRSSNGSTYTGQLTLVDLSSTR